MAKPANTLQENLRRRLWPWLAGYAVALTAIVLLVWRTRENVLQEFDTPAARAEWETWREAAPNQPGSGPVSRRPPSATEPPALVLMRDHFVVVMSAAIVFGSILFAAIMFCLRGVLIDRKPDDAGASV